MTLVEHSKAPSHDGKLTSRKSPSLLKDSHITIASGSLGELDNPFRQVQYLVVRAQGYSAYDLVDLRLDALGLYAGQEPQVEDFQEDDGTTLGIAQAQAQQTTVEQEFMTCASFLSLYWTGWWPVLHAVVDHSFSEDVSLSTHVTVDLLGFSTVESFAIRFYNIEDISKSEADSIVENLFQSTSSHFFDVIKVVTLIFAIGWAVTQILAMAITLVTQHLFYISLGISVIATVILMGLLLYAALTSGLKPWEAAYVFLGFALTFILMAISGKMAREGAVNKYGFFESFKSAFDPIFKTLVGDVFEASKIRSHHAIYIVATILAVVSVSISIGLFLSYLF